MSRSGYSDDCENIQLWRAAVERAIHGARGQHFMRKLLAALDAMPAKGLITDEIVDQRGDVCVLGAVDRNPKIDPDDRYAVSKHFGIAPAMAAEIVYMNDEWCARETPEQRWERMRHWVVEQIVPDVDESPCPPTR